LRAAAAHFRIAVELFLRFANLPGNGLPLLRRVGRSRDLQQGRRHLRGHLRIASAQRDVIGRHATTDALTAGHIGAPLTAQRLLYVRQPYGERSGRDRRGIHIG
jgi:hypothetical protein